MHSHLRNQQTSRIAAPAVRLVLLLPGLVFWMTTSLHGQDVPGFQEVHDAVGLHFQHHSPLTPERHLHLTMGSGVAWLDVDRDGWPDLCLAQGCAWQGHPQRFSGEESLDRVFRNRFGMFDDVTKPSGLISSQYSMGLAAGDFDNDGFVDLMISSFGAHRLYRNNGDGTFHDVSSQLVKSLWIMSASCTWFDEDGDGMLDLYVTNYLQIDRNNYAVCTQTNQDQTAAIPCPPRKYEWPADTVFRNLGDGRFLDVSGRIGLQDCRNSAGLGVVTGDFNDDQIIDLYVANDTTANFLLINDGQGKLTDTAIPAGAALNRMGEGEAGMGVASGDIDGDGRLDLFVGNYYGESNTLYRNEGQGQFLDVTAEYGLAAPSRTRLAFGTLLCDFNNDSWLDVFVANGHLSDQLNKLGLHIPFQQQCQMMISHEGRRFSDVSASSGTYFLRNVVGRGCAAADYDLDGQPDIVVQHLNDRAALLRNSTQSSNQFLSISLIGVHGNRDAIGARVEVELPNRRIVRQREGSSSYLSCSDSRLVIGLGDVSQPVTVHVVWPGGTAETVSGVIPGRPIAIVQGRTESSQQTLLAIPQ